MTGRQPWEVLAGLPAWQADAPQRRFCGRRHPSFKHYGTPLGVRDQSGAVRHRTSCAHRRGRRAEVRARPDCHAPQMSGDQIRPIHRHASRLLPPVVPMQLPCSWQVKHAACFDHARFHGDRPRSSQ